MAWALDLPQADFSVPFGVVSSTVTGTDLNGFAMLVKSVIDTGWWLANPFLGAPGRMKLYDFPLCDNLNFAIVKLIALFDHNYGSVLNLFFLLTFPLTVFTSLLVLRKFGVSYASAIAAGLLFAFMPYHFMRGEGHLLLSSYYPVPLVVMLCLWLWVGAPLPGQDKERSGGFGLSRTAVGVIVLVVGSWNPYYVFFGCFLIGVAGAAAAVRASSWRVVMRAAAVCGLILAVAAANQLPAILYHLKHGPNTQALVRLPGEADIYGLRISQMLLPITGHRIDALARFKSFYNASNGPINENDTAALGIVGAAGFLFLLARMLWGRPDRTDLLHPLAILSLAAVLLGTIGGLGSLFSYLVTPQIRCYNRISIFIAFMALFAVALMMDKWRQWLGSRATRTWAWYASLVALACVGIFDQITPRFVPPYQRLKAEEASDAEFIGRIEATVPRGAMIFQVPMVRFPEEPPVNRMLDYDLFRGYLHSKTIRWSYGAIKGRPDGRWADRLSGPLEQSCQILAFAGFSGIYVDRYGFADGGKAIESELEALLSEQPMVSRNGRLSFFDLSRFADALRGRYTTKEWQTRRELALRPAL